MGEWVFMWHQDYLWQWLIDGAHELIIPTRTESQNLNIYRLVLQLSLPNLLKPCVKLRMKMSLEQSRQAMLQLHLGDQ